MKTIIYGLCDPRTGELRYVGKTSRTLKDRMKGHLCDAKKGTAHRNRWIAALLRQGVKPEMFEIEIVDGDGCEAERHHIAAFRALGCRLTNLTDGGEGAPGLVPTHETRAKVSAAKKTNWADPEFRAKQSASIMSAYANPEFRAKLSAATKAYFSNPEGRAKYCAIQKAISNTPEGRARRSAQMKAYWRRRRRGIQLELCL